MSAAVMPINREQWLCKAAETMTGWLEATMGAAEPLKRPRISVGFGYVSGDGDSGEIVGQTIPSSFMDDRVAEVFISPVLRRGSAPCPSVLSVLLHELIHAQCNISGHGLDFATVASRLGLVDCMGGYSCCTADLTSKLIVLEQSLGRWPGSFVYMPWEYGALQDCTSCEPLDDSYNDYVAGFQNDRLRLDLGERASRSDLTLGEYEAVGDEVYDRPSSAGGSLLHEARLVLATTTRGGGEVSDTTISLIEAEVVKAFGGMTRSDAWGSYVMPSGQVKQEYVRVLDVAMASADGPKLEAIGRKFKQLADQQSVYIRCPNGNVIFL